MAKFKSSLVTGAYNVGYTVGLIIIFGTLAAVSVFPVLVLLAKVYWTEVQFIWSLW